MSSFCFLSWSSGEFSQSMSFVTWGRTASGRAAAPEAIGRWGQSRALSIAAMRTVWHGAEPACLIYASPFPNNWALIPHIMNHDHGHHMKSGKHWPLLLLSGMALLALLWIKVEGQRAVCDDQYGQGYVCLGGCWCSGIGGGNGQEPCEFYCITRDGWFWCPSETMRCDPEGPII